MEPDTELAENLFKGLASHTADRAGVTRDSYGRGEQIAHELIQNAGRALGLEVHADFAGNSYLTLPGRDRSAPVILVGSHLDSVRQGGNYDGAAGVVCGLSAIAGLQHAGVKPARDVVVAAWRAEEGCWFPETWLGSRMALGTLPRGSVDDLRRVDTQRSLAEHMSDLDLDPTPIREGRRYLDPDRIAYFLEVHIEQGPALDAEGIPVGIVTAIMGGPRYRDARIRGAYAHAGGAPRRYRRDSVAALGDLITAVNKYWRELENEAQEAVFTFGVVHTDEHLNSFSRVAGDVRFCLDARVANPATLIAIQTKLASLQRQIEDKHGVQIELGLDTGPRVLPMDRALQSSLIRSAQRCGITVKSMASGAGHDAGAFVECGVPTAMLFVRNQNGSHNPDEAMEMRDFDAATIILMDAIQF